MRRLNLGKAIEVKQVSDAGDVEGYGSTFGNVDSGWDIVDKGAFESSLTERGNPKMLWGHDIFEPPIGIWTDAKEDDKGLFVKGSINLDMQKGREVHSALKQGALDGLSIGFIPVDSDITNAGIRHIKEADLFEVSIVTFPMNESARVDAVKQLVDDGELSKTELERILRDAGFTRQQAKGLIARGYDGLFTRKATGNLDDDDELVSIVSELRQTMRG